MWRVAVILIGLLLSACALVEDQVPVNYVAPTNLTVVPGASGVAVDIAPSDHRVSNRDRISTKKNGYGMEMAAIRSTNDVVTLVGTAVERELASLGFQLGKGGVAVRVEVDTFYCDFKTGFFSGEGVAEVAFTLKAFKPGGDIAYSRSYRAVGMNKDVMIFSGDNARIALEDALTRAILQVIQDGDLHRALVAAGSKPPDVAGKPIS